jgi:hypothetical protein
VSQIGGTYAEYCVVDAQDLCPKPDPVSFAEAAAIPFAALSAFAALCVAGGLSRKDSSGAASALPIAHVPHARPIACVRSRILSCVRDYFLSLGFGGRRRPTIRPRARRERRGGHLRCPGMCSPVGCRCGGLCCGCGSAVLCMTHCFKGTAELFSWQRRPGPVVGAGEVNSGWPAQCLRR